MNLEDAKKLIETIQKKMFDLKKCGLGKSAKFYFREGQANILNLIVVPLLEERALEPDVVHIAMEQNKLLEEKIKGLTEALTRLRDSIESIRVKHTDIEHHNNYPSTVNICQKALDDYRKVMGET